MRKLLDTAMQYTREISASTSKDLHGTRTTTPLTPTPRRVLLQSCEPGAMSVPQLCHAITTLPHVLCPNSRGKPMHVSRESTQGREPFCRYSLIGPSVARQPCAMACIGGAGPQQVSAGCALPPPGGGDKLSELPTTVMAPAVKRQVSAAPMHVTAEKFTG